MNLAPSYNLSSTVSASLPIPSMLDALYDAVVQLAAKQELPQKGKMRCPNYARTGSCPKGKACRFAHSPPLVIEYNKSTSVAASLIKFIEQVTNLSRNPHLCVQRVPIPELMQAIDASYLSLKTYVAADQWDRDDYGDVYHLFSSTLFHFFHRVGDLVRGKPASKAWVRALKDTHDGLGNIYSTKWLLEREEKCRLSVLHAPICDNSTAMNAELSGHIHAAAVEETRKLQETAAKRAEIVEVLQSAFRASAELATCGGNPDDAGANGVSSEQPRPQQLISLFPFGSSCNMFGFGPSSDLDLVMLYGRRYHDVAWDFDACLEENMAQNQRRRQAGRAAQGWGGRGGDSGGGSEKAIVIDAGAVLRACKDAAIETGHFLVTELVETARVPVLKLLHVRHKIEVDICVNNALPLHNTKLLRQYALYDPRVRELAFVVKQWAKARGANNPHNGSLSSYSWVLMVIHFLQSPAAAGDMLPPCTTQAGAAADISAAACVAAPVLPCINYPNDNDVAGSDLAATAAGIDGAGDGLDGLIAKLREFGKLSGIEEDVPTTASAQTSPGTRNTDSIATLLGKFFAYYSTESPFGFRPSVKALTISRGAQFDDFDAAKLPTKSCSASIKLGTSAAGGDAGAVAEAAGPSGDEPSELNLTAGDDDDGDGDDDEDRNDGTEQNSEGSDAGSNDGNCAIPSSRQRLTSSKVALDAQHVWRFALEDPLDHHDLGSVVYNSMGQAHMMTELRRASNILRSMGSVQSVGSNGNDEEVASNTGCPPSSWLACWDLLVQKKEDVPVVPYLCRTCYSAEHSGASCPLNFCFACGGHGHIASLCPAPRRRSRGSTGDRSSHGGGGRGTGAATGEGRSRAGGRGAGAGAGAGKGAAKGGPASSSVGAQPPSPRGSSSSAASNATAESAKAGGGGSGRGGGGRGSPAGRGKGAAKAARRSDGWKGHDNTPATGAAGGGTAGGEAVESGAGKGAAKGKGKKATKGGGKGAGQGAGAGAGAGAVA